MLDLRFKGARSYVHGTDMLNAAIRELTSGGAPQPVEKLVFVINRMTARNLDLVVDEAQPPGLSPVASVRFERDGARRHAILVERPEPPRGRYAYDEDLLRACCRVDLAGRAIVLGGESPFTPIETIVAMTKALHLALFPGTAGWLFSRLEAPYWPPARFDVGVTVALAQSVGTRLTKSQVSLGRETLARVYFSLGEPA